MTTLYKALQRVEQKYDVPQDVWIQIEKKVYENLLKNSMGWVTDAKVHRDIARCLINGSSGYLPHKGTNYGRFMLHILRPRSFSKHFQNIHRNRETQIVIGGVPLEHQYFDYSIQMGSFKLKFDQDSTKDKIVEAIETNTNGRKIKGIRSMNKNQLYKTLMTLDELKLQAYKSNDALTWHLP
jgi:hypothetical protein